MHISVMTAEALGWLAIKPDGIYVDATVGAAGHSREIAQKLTTGRLIGLDKDPAAIEIARQKLSEFGDSVTLVQRDFAGLLPLLHDMQIADAGGGVDGILA